MISQAIKNFIGVIVLIFCSAPVFAFIWSVTVCSVRTLAPLIGPLYPTYFELELIWMYLATWLLLAVLGICVEFVVFVGWLLLRMSGRRGSAGQAYTPLAGGIFQTTLAVFMWTMRTISGEPWEAVRGTPPPV